MPLKCASAGAEKADDVGCRMMMMAVMRTCIRDDDCDEPPSDRHAGFIHPFDGWLDSCKCARWDVFRSDIYLVCSPLCAAKINRCRTSVWRQSAPGHVDATASVQ